jgi:transposase
VSVAQRHTRYQTVCGFAQYVHLEDPHHELLPPNYFGYRKTRRIPRIYSREEIERLLLAARQLADDDVAAVIASAKTSVGVPMVGLERDALMAIADDAYRAHRAFTTAKTKVDQLAATTPAATLAPVIGHTTAAAVFAEVGDARSFPCARAFLKAMGLNLKEKSSGTVHGQIKITKRGPSRVRQLLWLAIFRWIQKDPIANAWYQRKKQRDGGRASRAAVALMRKLAKGLYHVGRGGTFDSSKLFDTRRLQVVT